MSNKAVSPLIATVLVIGFAIALSGIMMTWGTSFVKDIQASIEESSQKNIKCAQDVSVNIKSAIVIGNKIKLVVENTGSVDIDKFNIRLRGSDGGDVVETGSGLSASGIQSFSVALDPNKFGNFNSIEAQPVITYGSEQLVCPNAGDTEEDLGFDKDGLIAYYKLEGNAEDSFGENDGSLNGNPNTKMGIFADAIEFDGTDDLVDLGIRSNFNLNTLTLEAWVYPYVVGAEKGIVAKDNHDFDFYLTGSSVVCRIEWANPLSSSVALNVNKWSHVACTYDGSNINIYINGENKGVRACNNCASPSSSTVRIGRWYGTIPYYHFNGIIDEVKIYNKAKTY